MAMKKFTVGEQIMISKKLAAWSLTAPYGERIARNFPAEHFLPDDRMELLLRFILNDFFLDSESFETEYAKECHNHVLKGGLISVTPYPKFYGAAIEKGVLIQHLTQNYTSRFPDNKEAEDFITGLKQADLPDDCKDLFIKQYSVWATWNEVDPTSFPFEFCSTCKANEVRANLGLNKMLIEKELLLIIYEVPKHIDVLRPTIADAELSQYFEPPHRSITKHGYSRTWERQKWMEKLNIKPEPRPEGIHLRFEFRHLQLPMQSRW